jgi:hypothetical protein
MSIIEKLTEGIVNRDMKAEGNALLNKWSATGLLEGLETQHQRATMARLLENQAKELLRESTGMTGGDVEGFASVAFPIVRRVFAGLIANDLVSVQPMSLPSGLIFFLDFTFSDDVAGQNPRLGQAATDSIYGQGVVGSGIIDGVTLNSANLDKQPYGFSSAYASPTGSIANSALPQSAVTLANNGAPLNTAPDGVTIVGTMIADDPLFGSMIGWDADLMDEHSGSFILALSYDFSSVTDFNEDHLSQIVLPLSGATSGVVGTQVRRLTQLDPNTAGNIICYYVNSTTLAAGTIGTHDHDAGSYEKRDTFTTSGLSEGAVAADVYSLENNANIPEIDIKVDSTAITATTKKLKAKWTPELGQDLNAYHNLDAEVELTSILSEQIALEIDREILADLVNGATAGTYYWSRSPGLFVERTTGREVGANTAAPDFTGTVSEWYETLIETINDVSAQIHRKTLRGGANFVVCGPEVANILEFTSGFRANVTADADKGMIGAVKAGSLSRKYDVIVDPYFPRNAVLVGRKGGSFLESGYVYAPYVPLQTTPTIFGVEDFVPRKGVMTRYGKKMVRPDMYGMVIIRGLLGETGS